MDPEPLWMTVPLELLAQEPLDEREVSPLTELDLGRIAVSTGRRVQESLSPTDTCFIDLPPAGDRAFASSELLH